MSLNTQELDKILGKADQAFRIYKKMSLKQRADFMRTIGEEIMALGDELIKTAAIETNLPEARLIGERARTVFQLNSYGEAAERGDWLEARIDTADTAKTPPKPDLRKMLVPLGPVLVFGASNFPFAYSTAGGDTACAFAAGCPVVVKAHPAHQKTSELVAHAILKAVEKCKMPDGIFNHIVEPGNAIGEYLVKHPVIKAVGFTGSYGGGRALFDAANQRKVPIPVFAEMGSLNPVFLMPDKLATDAVNTAKLYAGSITLGMGQFCTNPGLIFGIEGEALDLFKRTLAHEIEQVVPFKMLHQGIADNFSNKLQLSLEQKEVSILAQSKTEVKTGEGHITVAQVDAVTFLNNPLLHQEVFGPYSLIISCKNTDQMKAIVAHLEGQLTATVMATEKDADQYEDLFADIQEICGRFIFNNVPTGVEVCLSMQHGGPFPATTDSRYTSVGADGIKRFARPVAFQNWPDQFLPKELQNANPLHIWRTVNNQLSKEALS
ncbi:aldehyde dehydrogenase (NADP(+)) [Pedobacter sp.]|uniref:aldehyde dehydrogenase (NADP(+)) n=1 Tax=Pedobacter sp. TaxID=1411316 RepID=UPI00396CD6B5